MDAWVCMCRALRDLQLELWLSKDFDLGLLNNVGAVKILSTLGGQLNGFYILRWPRTFGDQVPSTTA